MSGTLYVVATPIGNLEDITLRALRILREVAVVAAEDTRRTARLLGAHGITTRTVSFHEHNTRARLPHLLARLANHESIALVTDAGTPGISDPGLELVQACIERGFPVDPIPGASAPLVALMASGLPMLPFTVFGFAPHRSNDRIKWLSTISKTPHTFSFFDSPLRIHATMVEAGPYLVDRQIMVARELTKSHQEFVRAAAGSHLFGHITTRGEITVIVGPVASTEGDVRHLPTDAEVVHEFGQLTDQGLTRREKTRLVGAQFGVSQRFVYEALERGLKIGRST
jgi:16S rRNA (cytidine1402-2'-O)-methyltransferase